jgi:hypothetical protein
MSNPAGIKYTFPAAESLTRSAALICVPVAAIPFLRRFFEDIQQPSRWATRDDWYRAYQVFGEMEAELMSGCLQELIESNRQIYRLLDTALNGTVYTVTPAESPLPILADPTRPTIEPAIPDAPPDTAPQFLPLISVRNRLSRLVDLVDNAMNGTVIDAAPTLQPDIRNNLEAIRVLIEQQGENTDEIEGLINLVVMALA